ncbi:MAG: C10 family peptidase [Bacteroidales bacterium]|nr:C10 family peptidase [Bacteroidales bacterium]MBR1799468.1 C10 family peptidase [Bacteroidales bacterium]
MTKRITLALVAMLMALATNALPVSVDEARQVATNFFIRQGGADKSINLVECSASRGLRQTYLFIPENGKGFVLIAKDNVARPILGYSLVNEFPVDIAPATRAWLNWYADEIEMQISVGHPVSDAVTNEWRNLLQADVDEPVFAVVVAPMVTTQWNQSPYYNELCPYNSTDNYRCVTGCVATATAQVMKYWNHPVQGKGSESYSSTYGTLSANFAATTYDWANMPVKLTSTSSTAQINAVATLMSHIGVAVHMSYGRSSGAVTASTSSVSEVTAERALFTYFGYSKSIHSVRKDYVSDSVWQALLDNELANNRPFLYSGRDSTGGHAFVCDGRNNAGYYHYNWGWGGYCDDYYPIDALNPAPGGIGGNATYHFNLKQTAIIGICPETTTSGTFTLTARAENSSMGSVSGSGTKRYGDTVTMMATAASGYRFLHWTDGMNYNPRTVIVGGNATYTAAYAPLTGDTLQYDNGIFYTSWSNKYWGIKFEAADLRGHTYFTAVMAYLKSGSHDVKIYSGTSISSANLIQSLTYNNTTGEGWKTISMPLPMVVDSTKPLWITLHNASQDYPATTSVYSGNNNSAFVSSNGTSWTNPSQRTFLIRGIFSSPQNYYTVTANASPAAGGTVVGAGRCLEGRSLTLTATPATCYHFAGWSDGVQLATRTVSVFGNASYTALFVRDTMSSVFPVTACDTYQWIDGNTYTASNNTATYTLPTSQECVSIVRLHLTINHATSSTQVRTECDSYLWLDSTLTQSGTYRKTMLGANVNGCDSVNELHLTINHASYDSIDSFACAYLRWFDSTYSESGIYAHTIAQGNAEGCDSTVYMTLKIGAVYEYTDSVVATSPYTWRNDSVYAETGIYQMRGLTQQGCDSVYTLVLTFNNSIDDVSEAELTVYPNPTVDRLTVVGEGIESVQLFDVTGRCIATITDGSVVEMGNLAAGIYVLRVTFEGDKIATRKIVKR